MWQVLVIKMKTITASMVCTVFAISLLCFFLQSHGNVQAQVQKAQSNVNDSQKSVDNYHCWLVVDAIYHQMN